MLNQLTNRERPLQNSETTMRNVSRQCSDVHLYSERRSCLKRVCPSLTAIVAVKYHFVVTKLPFI